MGLFQRCELNSYSQVYIAHLKLQMCEACAGGRCEFESIGDENAVLATFSWVPKGRCEVISERYRAKQTFSSHRCAEMR